MCKNRKRKVNKQIIIYFLYTSRLMNVRAFLFHISRLTLHNI